MGASEPKGAGVGSFQLFKFPLLLGLLLFFDSKYICIPSGAVIPCVNAKKRVRGGGQGLWLVEWGERKQRGNCGGVSFLSG